jgi:hypothetical protein
MRWIWLVLCSLLFAQGVHAQPGATPLWADESFLWQQSRPVVDMPGPDAQGDKPALTDAARPDSAPGRVRCSGDRSGDGWWGAVAWGMQSMLAGLDKLLFLVLWMIPAPLRVVGLQWGAVTSRRRALKRALVTACSVSVGRSIGLVLGGLAAFSLAAYPAEQLMALSILVSCLHAWRPVLVGTAHLLAGVFGLALGLYFAPALADLGLQGWPHLAALLGFNLGLELVQMLVVAAVWPGLVLLARWRFGPPVRHALIGVSSFMAMTWLAQRL